MLFLTLTVLPFWLFRLPYIFVNIMDIVPPPTWLYMLSAICMCLWTVSVSRYLAVTPTHRQCVITVIIDWILLTFVFILSRFYCGRPGAWNGQFITDQDCCCLFSDTNFFTVRYSTMIRTVILTMDIMIPQGKFQPRTDLSVIPKLIAIIIDEKFRSSTSLL